MKQQPLILLHEESLRMTHPVFKAAPKDTRVIYIWDDAYVLRTGYSLKRLIFIYETLSMLELDIIRGDTSTILQEINPSLVYLPASNNPLLLEMFASVREVSSIEIVADIPFVQFKKTKEFSRFFQYWQRAEKKALLYDGGVNA